MPAKSFGIAARGEVAKSKKVVLILMSLAGLLLTGFGTSPTPAAPDTPTLSLADNGDGTGAVATVASSSSGSSNVVSTVPVDGDLGGGTDWTAGGSRTGDGTVSLTLDPGYYWARVVSTLNSQTAVSIPIYFVVTSGDDALFKQCLDAVLARLQGMTFSGINSSNFFLRKLPWNRKVSASEGKPATFITPVPEKQSAREGTNNCDDIGYGVAIVVVSVSNEDLVNNLGRNTLWRQQINKAFRNQRLPGVVGNYRCEVEPGSVFNPSFFGANYDVFSLTIRCWCRETRGIS